VEALSTGRVIIIVSFSRDGFMLIRGSDGGLRPTIGAFNPPEGKPGGETIATAIARVHPQCIMPFGFADTIGLVLEGFSLGVGNFAHVVDNVVVTSARGNCNGIKPCKGGALQVSVLAESANSPKTPEKVERTRDVALLGVSNSKLGNFIKPAGQDAPP
jgi:hypothetical protein